MIFEGCDFCKYAYECCVAESVCPIGGPYFEEVEDESIRSDKNASEEKAVN